MRKSIIGGGLVVAVICLIYYSYNQAQEIKELRQANSELVNIVDDLISRIGDLEDSVGTQSVSTMNDLTSRISDLEDAVGQQGIYSMDDIETRLDELNRRVSDLELWSK